MDLQLAGRVVFIAGASRGIGYGIAQACLAEGALVALTARNPEILEKSRRTLADAYGEERVWAYAGDMRESEAIAAALAGCEAVLGPIWGAVANVGLYPCPPGYDLEDATWEAGLTQNLSSAFRLARGALKRMKPRGEGSLLFISSIAGMEPMGTPLTYGTSKAALNHLSREISKLTAVDGVRVNTLAPGNIRFPGGEWEARTNGPRAEAWNRWIEREVPMKRFGTTAEIGDVAVFLLSPRASFLTGAVIPVDGGQLR